MSQELVEDAIIAFIVVACVFLIVWAACIVGSLMKGTT